MKETINELYDRLGLHKWWCELLPEDSIIHSLPTQEELEKQPKPEPEQKNED